MKRYLVFSGNSYYASGGWLDFKKDFTATKAAIEFANSLHEEDGLSWVHVVDSKTLQIIAYVDGSFCGNTQGSYLKYENALKLTKE